MIKIHLQTADKLSGYLERLESIRKEKDLPGLHRLVNDIQIQLSESIVHENRKILLDGFRVDKIEKIEEYFVKLNNRLNELYELSRAKAEGKGKK